MAVLYRVDCEPTGKSYIGVCLRSVRQRWLAHCSDARRGSNFPLHVDIRVYGGSAFRCYALRSGLPEDLELLMCLELRFIEKHNTLVPHGYNKRAGGGTRRHSEETKRKMSQRRKEWMSDSDNLKRLSESIRKRKNSVEGKQQMCEAGSRSWKTRRERYTPEQISEHMSSGHVSRDRSESVRRGWITRKRNQAVNL